MQTCPVCGEELQENRDEKIVADHRGVTYHFCSEEHKDEFEEQPGQYAAATE